jgi:hypothetical protein
MEINVYGGSSTGGSGLVVFIRCRPKAQCIVCSVLHACDKVSAENVRKIYEVFINKKEITFRIL